MDQLFNYRMRMIMGAWVLITNIETLPCGSYDKAVAKAKELEAKGYVDADRG